MKLGTIVLDSQIYNLDYMTSDEVKDLLKSIEAKKQEALKAGDNFTEEK